MSYIYIYTLINYIYLHMFPTYLPPGSENDRGECAFRVVAPRIGRAPRPARPGDGAQGPDADQQRGGGAATGG